jgi:hypothetical protein
MTTSHPVSQAMALRIFAAGIVVMTMPAVESSETDAWKKFALDDQSFSVSMPGVPVSKEVHTNSFIGDVTTHEYYVDDGLDSYSVEFTDLPGFAVSFSGNETIYEHAKGALLKKTLSKSIAFTDVTLNGVHGKKLVYDTPSKPNHPEMQGEARFFLVDDRLYTADAVVEMTEGSDKLTHFFSSLEVKH